MRTIWQALAWKEWHEHKWKLAAVAAIVTAVSSVTFFDYDYGSLASAAALSIVCIAPLSIFVGASVAAGERARNTLAFTQALPIPMWRIACHKVVAGTATCVIPLLLNLALLCLANFLLRYAQVTPAPKLTLPVGGHQSATDAWIWFALWAMVGTVVSFGMYAWALAVGVNRKDEISASAWTLSTIAIWWVLFIMIAIICKKANVFQEEWVPPIGISLSPGGYGLYLVESHQTVPLHLATFAALLLPMGLAIVFVRRFGASNADGTRLGHLRRISATRLNWLDSPRSSPLMATLWKQCRESGPIALAGLAGVFVTTSCILLVPDGPRSANDIAGVTLAATAIFGLVATLVVGIGVFLNDLTPSIHTFWRSRPIQIDAWYWTKFAVGLFVLAVTFSIPFLLAAAQVGVDRILDTPGRVVLSWEVLMWLLVPLWIYSSVVLMTILVRHAVYAVILSWAAMYLSVLTIVGISRLAQFVSGSIRSWEDMSDPTTGELVVTMSLASVAFAVIGWLAVRNDWGRKSRY